MKITTASLNEVKRMVDWAAVEGWNPGLNDAECYFQADPTGFFVGYIGDTMVACISAIKYHQFGFIGFYMVIPSARGKGLGWQIWQHAMSYLKSCNVALDGVVEQQHNYQKSGFTLAHNNIRYGWKNKLQKNSFMGTTHLAAEKHPAEISTFLKPYFPASRKAFDSHWRAQQNATAKIVIENKQIRAYGVIRSCHDGYKIGPLFAETPQAADTLLVGLTEQAKTGANIYMDVPGCNQSALSLIAKKNAEKVFETARMYTGEVPIILMNNTYGMTSFEIG